MVGRRTSSRVSAVSSVSNEKEFVSADKFDFELELGSPKGAMTRGRRSSMQLNKPPVPAPTRGRKRMSMMPTVQEKPSNLPKRRSIAVTSSKPPAKKTEHKGIEIKEFYVSPEKKPAKRRSVQPRPTKANVNLKEFVASPKKVSRKSFLSEEDIIESLEEMFDKTPTDGKRPEKTFETEAPEKVKPRRNTIQLKSAVVMVSKKNATTPKTAKEPVKATSPKSPAKVASPEARTPIRAPSRTTRQTPGRISKSARKTPKPKLDIPNEDQEISMKSPSASKAVVAKTPLKNTKTLSRNSKTPAKGAKRPAESAKTPAEIAKTPAESAKTPAKGAKTPTESAKTQAKSAKTPAGKNLVAKESNKTPSSSIGTSLKRKTMTDSPAPAKKAKLEVKAARSTPNRRESSRNATPVRSAHTKLVAKKTMVLKKTENKPVSTPVQVNPANLLKKNMKVKVETAIVSKIATRPDSSPYLLVNQDENSPKFEKVSSKVEEVKTHITGTPAVNRRTRRFGTTIQPSLLAIDSPVPQTERRTVQSSTPVRGKQPLPDMVEATPIRAPILSSSPASPAPEMVTGGLAKLCVIM